MRMIAVLCALFLLIGGVVLMPAPVHGAGWISVADAEVAPGVQDSEQELLKHNVYARDVVDTTLATLLACWRREGGNTTTRPPTSSRVRRVAAHTPITTHD